MSGANKVFSSFNVNISKTCRKWPKVIINDQQEVAYALSIDTEIDDLDDHELRILSEFRGIS